MGGFAPEAYREENYTYSYKDAFLESIKQGNNHFDTALSYRYTKSTQELAEALKEAFEKNLIQRDELVLSAKAGFIPLDYPFPKNPYGWIDEELVKKDRCTKEDIISDQYCLTPEFIEYSLDRTLDILGVESMDIFYIQNPEFALGFIPREALYQKLEKAFVKCEELIQKGKIKAYGIATWNAFMYESTNQEFLALKDMVSLAGQGFRHVLFPYSLAKIQAATIKSQPIGSKYVSLFEAASELELGMTTVSPFLRMNLFKAPFGNSFRALCGAYEMSDVQRALQFSRSNGFSMTTVFSSQNVNHIRHNYELKAMKKIPNSSYAKIFML